MKDQNSKDELFNNWDSPIVEKPHFENSRRPKLKKMNRQPLDGDYFSLEELSEIQREKQAQSENEFRYHSIREDLIKRKKEQSRLYRKGGVFGDVFNRDLEEVYDLDQLDSIQDYDQFKEETTSPESSLLKEEMEESIHGKFNPTKINPIEEKDSSIESGSPITHQSEEEINVNVNTVENNQESQEFSSIDEVSLIDNVSLEEEGQENQDRDLGSYQEVQVANDLMEEENIKDLTSQAVNQKHDFLKAISDFKLKVKNFEDQRANHKMNETSLSPLENQESDIETSDLFENNQDPVDFLPTQAESQTGQVDEKPEELSEEAPDALKVAEDVTTNLVQDSQADDQDQMLLDSDSHEDLAVSEDRPSSIDSSEDKSHKQADDGQTLSDQVSQQTKVFREPILTDAVLNDIMVEEDITIEKKIVEDAQGSKERLIKKDNFVSGAAWLSIGYVISRVIGALYVIPWASWFGEGWTQANTLYSAGYKPYTLFLAFGTAGFPSAIAKQMAYYHSQKEYRVADKLFKNSLLIMVLTGLFSGSLLYFLAPILAEQSTNVNKEGAVMVLRSLVPPLLILPTMSFFRGYFQGFNDMKPSAVSQLLEQIARVLYMLIATYAIVKIYQGEVTDAVVHSTFAAFIGAVASMLYLIFIYFKRLPDIKKLLEQSADKIEVDFKESFKIMALDSLPFIILGSGIIIMQLIDTYSFGKILENTSILLLTEIDELYGVLSLDVDKLVMIIVALSIALSSAFVPSLTGTFAQKNIKATSKMVHHILNVFFMVMIPSALGMAAIADNLYSFFYPLGSSVGPSLLITASLSAIVLGLYTVLSTILQSMNYRRLAVRFLLVGIFVKIVLQYPLVMLLQAHGAILSTMLGLAMSSLLMWIKLHKVLDLNTYQMKIDLAKIVVSSILMAIAAMMWNRVFNLAFGPVGRWLTFVKVILVVLPAVAIYLVLMFILGMISLLIGDRFKDLQEKLRVRI